MVGEGIADVDLAPALVNAADVAQPRRHGERNPRQRQIAGETLARRREQPLRKLLRSVHGNLPGAMPDCRVGEALQEHPCIVGQVSSEGSRNNRNDLFSPEPPDEFVQDRILDRVRDGLVTRQIAEIG